MENYKIYGNSARCSFTYSINFLPAIGMDYAIENHAKRLFILSNSKLKPALHIYQKYGFTEIKLDDYEYDRGNIAFEYIV